MSTNLNENTARTKHNGMRELTAQEIQAVSGGDGTEVATYAVGLGTAVRWGSRFGLKGMLLAGAGYTLGYAAGYVATTYGV